MKFKMFLVFLGIASNDFTDKDGKQQIYYRISFFDLDSCSPLQVNVMESPRCSNMIDRLVDAVLGDHFSVTFFLRPQDKLYKLQIVDVTAA